MTIQKFLIILFAINIFTLHAKPPVKSVMVVGLFTGKALVIINGQQHLLRSDGKTINGVRLISANSNQAVLNIDGRNETLTADTAVGAVAAHIRQQKQLQIWPDRRGMYAVIGSINGFTVNFLVDTGATYIAMSSKEADKLNINYKTRGKMSYASTASGMVRTYNIMVKKVSVGGIILHDVKASVIKGNFPQRVLLGMSFLSRIRMQNKGKALVLIQE